MMTTTANPPQPNFVEWIAPRVEGFRHVLDFAISAVTDQAAHQGMERPENYAHIAAGINTLSQYAKESGVFHPEQAKTFEQACCRNAWGLLQTQTQHQGGQNEATRFLSLLAAALSVGRCHLSLLRGHPLPVPGWFQPTGERVGWLDGDVVYLDGRAAHAAVSAYARDQGATINATQRAIFRQLHQGGGLIRTATESGKRRLQIRKRVPGAQPRLYAVPVTALTQ